MIALIDYGMGNMRSVEKALVRVGGDVRIVSDRKSVLAADSLVLPGVGAHGTWRAPARRALELNPLAPELADFRQALRRGS